MAQRGRRCHGNTPLSSGDIDSQALRPGERLRTTPDIRVRPTPSARVADDSTGSAAERAETGHAHRAKMKTRQKC